MASEEPVAVAPSEPVTPPPPRGRQTMFLAGIFIMHLLAALYFAKAVAAPILLAFVLYLLL